MSISSKMLFHAVLAFDPNHMEYWQGLKDTSYFSADQSKQFTQAGKLLTAVHDPEPLIYDNGTKALYLWLDADDPKIDKGVMIQGDVKNGELQLDSIILSFGSEFRGAIMYQRACCNAPSLGVLNLSGHVFTRDNLQDTMDSARSFWDDKAFPADQEQKEVMAHAIRDITGNCSSHGHNARPGAMNGHSHNHAPAKKGVFGFLRR